MIPASEGELRRVHISDSYHLTSNCLMNQELGVKFLQNPIIRVLKWSLETGDDNSKYLHIMEFTTVKNSVNFPLLGNPTTLSATGPIKPSEEFPRVLRPDRYLNNLLSNIMTAMTRHYISGGGSASQRKSHNRLYIQPKI